MNRVGITMLFVLNFALMYVGFAQPLVKGPKNGSVPSGVSITTDGFPLAPAAVEQGIHEVPFRPVDPPLLAPKNVMPPKGPEGSNYFEDRGLHSLTSTAGRPVVLQNFQGIQTPSQPPDPAVAVGPNHVVACVNSTFRIWDKAGNVLKTISLSSWFLNVRPGLSFSDPRVIYDHFADRWVMIGIDAAQSTTPILLSVSDDDNPLGTWYNWALPGQRLGDSTTVNFSDHPKLGFDDQALYITSREFQGLTGPRRYSKLRIVGKAQLYANTAGPVTWADFWDFKNPDSLSIAPDFLEPAITFGHPGVEFLVFSSPYSTGTFFTLWKLSDPLTSPAVTGVNVPVVTYTRPTSVPAQLGRPTSAFDGGSTALWGAVVYRDSSLWAVHSVANPLNNANSAIHYMRFNPFTNSNLEDAVMGLQGSWHFYPEIMPDADKNIVITYSRSSATEYVGAYVSGRKNTDPPGLSPSVILKNGESPYSGSRWGDYMGIALDPIDSSAVWAFTQYGAQGNWGTWVGKVKIDTARSVFMNVPQTSITLLPTQIGPGQRSDTAMVIVQSNGADTLIISNITVPNSPFALINAPALPWSIPPGSGTFGITFLAEAVGNYTDSLIITGNDPLNPTAIVRVSATGFAVNPAVRGLMYATTGTGAGSRLFTVDTSTAAATPVGAYGSGYTQAVSVRVHPTTHQILGLIPTSANANYVLARINSAGGDAHPSLAVKGVLLKGMAFRGDTLYIANIGGPIYRINMTTGDTTRVATTGLSIGGLDFHPLTGELWASTRTNANIYKINLPSGTPTLVGSTGLGTTADIMFNSNGALFGVTGTGATINQLIRINTTTGVGTLIGSMGISSVQAIAMYPDSFTVGVQEIPSSIPTQYTLDQNYPNPFNPTTQIRYGLPQQSHVRVTIYNVVGQEIARLYEGEQTAGFHVVTWNGMNSAGVAVSSSIYFYKLEASGTDRAGLTQTRKMMLLK